MLNILVHNLQIHKGSQSVLFVRTVVPYAATRGTLVYADCPSSPFRFGTHFMNGKYDHLSCQEHSPPMENGSGMEQTGFQHHQRLRPPLLNLLKRQ